MDVIPPIIADPMDQPVRPSDLAAPEKGRSSGKITNSLVALSSAAILTVYAAGYVRTRAAADRFAVEAADLRTAAPRGGAVATAAPPPDVVEVGKPAEVAPSVPASPAPTAAGVTARANAAPEPPATTVADSTKAASAVPEAPAPPIAPPGPPGPAATEEANTQPSAVPAPAPVPAAVEAAVEPPAPPPARKEGQPRDGTFFGWGYSRHGDIQAAIVVKDGRVISADITQCLTRYSCDVIEMLPAQVLSRQNAFVDLISGATESANAYSNAIFRALVLSMK